MRETDPYPPPAFPTSPPPHPPRLTASRPPSPRLFPPLSAPLAWFPIYFGSRHKIICMSMCTSLSALVTLVLLFFPKLYIILFRPEKNDRSAFKTATTVRCHIGSSNKASMSRPSNTTSAMDR
ncbi:Metabotropic glutamate receptor 5 [Chionoecetes opilio]|uniref:Metabotropic glutamate receptor 5 n=1 Tax=Chionoecetes opilio TaxID=41210 RepID=A0A8J4YDI6_CHIOP|nr:Metabotropic glutamate receptor 5 [Chionoecetes opilio]